MATVEYITLDPVTLEPSSTGQKYRKTTLDSGSIALEAVSDSKTEVIPVDASTECVVQYNFDLTKGDYVEVSRTTRPVDLSVLKSNKINELAAAKTAAIEAGFTSNATGTPIKFGYDPIDAAYLHKKATMLALNPSITSIPWKTADHGFMTFTRDQFIQIVNDGASHEETLEFEYLQLQANVSNATTAADVGAIVW